jgi:hypothetical protein
MSDRLLTISHPFPNITYFIRDFSNMMEVELHRKVYNLLEKSPIYVYGHSQAGTGGRLHHSFAKLHPAKDNEAELEVEGHSVSQRLPRLQWLPHQRRVSPC